MQAITTKYVGHTNTKPSRIVARTGNGGFSVSLGANSMPWGSDDIRSHKHVAELLRDKMKWKGELIGGGVKTGFVFVFKDVFS